MALGASLRDAVASIVVPGLKLAAIGTAVGLLLTWFASTLLQGLIWGVQPRDPRTYAAVAAFIFLIAVVASLLPALQLRKLDPMRALRQE